MFSPIRLISTDFDGTIVSHLRDPVLDPDCLDLLRHLQRQGAAWAINTGRSVDFLEHGLTDLEFPCRPDFILTSERDVFRPGTNGTKWEPFGDWNDRCARAHAELFRSAASILGEVMDFVNQKTKALVIHELDGPAGIRASSEEEMDRVTEFIDQARQRQPAFHYNRNTVYLRFSHTDYHKGAALGELGRLLDIPRESIFAAGDHHNDITMLDGKYAAMPACPANAIPEVKRAVRTAGGYVAEREHGAGVYDALRHFAGDL